MIYGGIEAGGTKWVCAIGTKPGQVAETETFPTTTPDETLERAAAFFSRNGKPAGIGIGSFGPIDLRGGRITTTPKTGWANTEIVAALRSRLGVPITVDTDVNAAALAEHRWGAARGLATFSYVTVGTGIGGGGMVEGRLMHGLLHPELGHMRIPHDRGRDPFDGICPYHGDCFEGLASGEAMAARWGKPAAQLESDDPWRLEAEYLALGVVNLICALSPERVILGGGVMKEARLLPLLRVRVRELLGGYGEVPELVTPALGDQAGVLGALELARLAAGSS